MHYSPELPFKEFEHMQPRNVATENNGEKKELTLDEKIERISSNYSSLIQKKQKQEVVEKAPELKPEPEKKSIFHWPDIIGRGEPSVYYSIVKSAMLYLSNKYPKAHSDVLFRNAIDSVKRKYNVTQRLDISSRTFENYMKEFKNNEE